MIDTILLTFLAIYDVKTCHYPVWGLSLFGLWGILYRCHEQKAVLIGLVVAVMLGMARWIGRRWRGKIILGTGDVWLISLCCAFSQSPVAFLAVAGGLCGVWACFSPHPFFPLGPCLLGSWMVIEYTRALSFFEMYLF